MATCKWCEKSGMFVRVDRLGVCSSCSPIVEIDVAETRRLTKDSVDVIEKSTVLDTRLSRCDFLIELFGRLSKYESKGIPVIDPLPSTMIENSKTWRNSILTHTLTMQLATVFADSSASKTTKAKLRPLDKFMKKLLVYQQKYPDAGLDSLIANVQEAIDEVKASELSN
jgi:hypothetical protein